MATSLQRFRENWLKEKTSCASFVAPIMEKSCKGLQLIICTLEGNFSTLDISIFKDTIIFLAVKSLCLGFEMFLLISEDFQPI